MKWCLTNTDIQTDRNGNIVPIKNQSPKQRIDGTAALLDCYVGLYEHYNEIHNRNLRGGEGMKLKDKKVDIGEYQYTSDAIGNRVKTLVTVATVWAYFRQLSMKESYGVTTQAQEEVLFQIGYRTDITTANVITYNIAK